MPDEPIRGIRIGRSPSRGTRFHCRRCYRRGSRPLWATAGRGGEYMAQTEQDRNKEVIRQFFRRLEAGDVDGAIALFAKHGTFWSPSTRKTSTMEEFAAALRWV